MKELLAKIKKFFKGSESFSVIERPKTFWKYYIRYTLNWGWIIGSLFFVVMFSYSAWNKQAPVYLFLLCIPVLMIIYNILDEYNAFQWYITKKRSVTAKRLMYIFYGACGLILLGVIITMIVFEIAA